MRNYWRQRLKKELEAAQDREVDRQKALQQLYTDALNDLQYDIDALFNRYRSTERITLSQAKKRASLIDLTIFNRRAKRYVEALDMSESANRHMRLYNLKGNVSRLTLMKAYVKLAMYELAGQEEQYIKKQLEVDMARQLAIQSGIFNLSVRSPQAFKRQAVAILNKSFHGGNWSDKVWKRQAELASYLNKTIQRMIMQGKHSTTFTSEVRQTFNVTAYQAKRLLVTETARVQTEVQRQSMIDQDIKHYEFIAEPSACKLCKPLDGQVFKVSEMEVGKNASPMHPNCKCSSAPYESRKELEEMLSEIEAVREAKYSDIKKFKRTQRFPKESMAGMLPALYQAKKRAYQQLTRDKFADGTDLGQSLFTQHANHTMVATLLERDQVRMEKGHVYLDMFRDTTDPRGAGVGYFHEFGHQIEEQLGHLFTKDSRLLSILQDEADLLVSNGVPQSIFDDARWSAVSDMISGLSEGNVVGQYHHPRAYWNKTGNIQSEFFAHFFEAQFDAKRRKILEKTFPEAYNYVKDKLEGR